MTWDWCCEPTGCNLQHAEKVRAVLHQWGPGGDTQVFVRGQFGGHSISELRQALKSHDKTALRAGEKS